MASAGLKAAVDCILVAAVDGERGFERFPRDFPFGAFVRMGVAVGHEQAVEKLEQMPRHAQRALPKAPRLDTGSAAARDD